jgi:hypothetical protein
VWHLGHSETPQKGKGSGCVRQRNRLTQKANAGRSGTSLTKEPANTFAIAQNTVQELGRRTRAVERKLRNVETAELPNGGSEYFALPLE